MRVVWPGVAFAKDWYSLNITKDSKVVKKHPKRPKKPK